MFNIKLNHTIELISNSFEKAEEKTREKIQLNFADATEEQITDKLQDEIGDQLREAGKTKAVALAFQKDLEQAIRSELGYCLPYGVESEIKSISNGLVAEVSWHKRHIEAKTGGDFGITIIQPRIAFFDRRIEIERCAEKRGLLVQAKRKRYNEPWGGLTDKQMELLDSRMQYLSILGYRYIDPQNKELDKFSWSLCENFGIESLKNWIEDDRFPRSTDTKNIVMQLGLGKIGTADKEIIKEIIEPQNTPTMIIRIDWSDKDPGFFVRMLNQQIENLTKQNRHINYINP